MRDVFSIISISLMLFFFVCFVIAVIKIIKGYFAPIKTVNAVVTDVYRTEVFSKAYSGMIKQKYVVVFSAGGKKLSFEISEFSASGYRINDCGVLKYKGNRLIDFH